MCKILEVILKKERKKFGMDIKKNDMFRTTIEDMSDQGAGIGKTDGYTWFIKDTVV